MNYHLLKEENQKMRSKQLQQLLICNYRTKANEMIPQTHPHEIDPTSASKT